MKTVEREIGDLMGIREVSDGRSNRYFGNYLGLYGVPPQGGFEWHAVKR